MHSAVVLKRAHRLRSDLVLQRELLKIAQGQVFDPDFIEKAWSDRAREAAAEARRHRAQATFHREAATGGGPVATAHNRAAAMHDKAAARHEKAGSFYGRSKLRTMMFGSGGLSGVLMGTGLHGIGVQGLRAMHNRHKAEKLGHAADALSASLKGH